MVHRMQYSAPSVLSEKLGKGIDPKEGILDCSLLIASSVLAIIGAVWAFLPQEMILSK